VVGAGKLLERSQKIAYNLHKVSSKADGAIKPGHRVSCTVLILLSVCLSVCLSAFISLYGHVVYLSVWLQLITLRSVEMALSYWSVSSNLISIELLYCVLCVCLTGGASVSKQRADLIYLCILWLPHRRRRACAHRSAAHETGLFRRCYKLYLAMIARLSSAAAGL